MEGVFEISCMCGQLFNNVTVFTIEMVRSDIMSWCPKKIISNLCYLSKPTGGKNKLTLVSDSRTNSV